MSGDFQETAEAMVDVAALARSADMMWEHAASMRMLANNPHVAGMVRAAMLHLCDEMDAAVAETATVVAAAGEPANV
jgi:hypothetical protein